MKKLLAIVVLGLLWSKIGYADHQCGTFKEIKDSIVCKSGDVVNEHTCKCEGFFDQFNNLPEKKPLKKMSGSTLFCRNEYRKTEDFGIDFKFMNRVTITAIDTDKERIQTINGTYEELSDKILINYKNKWGEKDQTNIYRNTGSMPGYNATCELYADETFSLRERLEQRLNSYIQKKSSGNKF
ncbi:hypothetical protein N8016_03435 [Pelagibacteraceae bacterium]|nr:hypothetical protein [Pelagibacteraceae bacterium]